MKFVMIIVLATACGNWVNYAQIKTAEDLCKNNGGVERVYAKGEMFDSIYSVRCKDKARFYDVSVSAK